MIKYYSAIRFKKTDQRFMHNLKEDYACFVLWKDARPFRKAIRNLLSSRFEIMMETEIEWSDKYFHDNANRLYEAPIFDGMKINKQSLYTDKIGDNRFILFVIKDAHPQYTYAMSVSKKLELSNLNTVKAKYEMRDWIQKESGVQYGVHSTNSIYEFFFQAPLLLGVDVFEQLLKGEKPLQDRIIKDLEGAEGWESYEQVFRILNASSNYLVQRSFESLPRENPEKDIDFLTDNYQRLASALGVKQSRKRPYKGVVNIAGEAISVDLRFIGDKYYDVAWEKEMLKNKTFKNGVFRPREDDYFFSLLFHCKVHKNAVKEKYIAILDDLSKKLHFGWFKTSLLTDDAAIGKILNGYFQTHGYFYEVPIDEGVYRNKSVIKHLQKNNLISSRELLFQDIKDVTKQILPDRVVTALKKMLKKE